MSIKALIFITILIVSCTSKQDRILPEHRTLRELVYSSVTIQPDSLYEVFSMASGILDENLKEEGDLISKNTPLFQITNSTPILHTKNSKLALELAKENFAGNAAILKGLKDDIETAALKFKNDSVNYARQKKLWNQNIGTKVEYDTKKLYYEISENNLTSLKHKYNRTEKELLTLVKQAQNNYETSLITTKDFTIKSKINGKVYALYKEPGELITTLEPLATIGSASKFVIEMLVDEVDIIKILENQEVVITLDAYPGDIFTGKISKIYPKKDERNQTFKVEAIFDKSPKILYPGLSGEGNIIIAKKENVLSIPIDYLIEKNKVNTDRGLMTIKTGLQNMEYIEVLSGITKYTYLYKPKS